MGDNIIKLKETTDEKTVSLKEAAAYLNLTYSTARRRILDKANNIGFFDYGGGIIKIVFEDLKRYKANCYRKGGIPAQ